MRVFKHPPTPGRIVDRVRRKKPDVVESDAKSLVQVTRLALRASACDYAEAISASNEDELYRCALDYAHALLELERVRARDGKAG
jgi:hypothetical protein